MLCAVDNFPLVLARFPVKPGMTTDRTPPVISTELSPCHLDRAERVERSPSPTRPQKNTSPTPHMMHVTPSDSFLSDLLPDGAEKSGKTPKNGTVHHVFRHFDVGRSELQHFPEEIYTG